MAIVKDGILGPFQNKVGTVIGRKFRGLDVMTGLYKKKTENPPSEAQLRQQARFGMLSTFLYDAADLVEPGFKKFVKAGQSPVNAAYKFNFPQAFIEDGDNIQINFPKIIFSRGPVETPNCPSVMLIGADKIKFSWLPQAENMNSRYGDKGSFLIYSVEKKKVVVLRDKELRGVREYEYEIEDSLQGDTLHCYMSFNNERGKLAGNSVYVGLVQ
jgi:hypothetical protein